MTRKTAFVSEMILKTLNQHQQAVPPAVHKEATLDYEVDEILNIKNVNDHDKAKLYSDVLQKYLTAKEQITPTGNISPVVTQTTPLSMYSNEYMLGTVPKNTRHELKTCYVSLDKAENYIGKTTEECRIKIREITDSNIVDLINYLMRSRKTFNPRGWLPFTEALKYMHVSNDLIGNPRKLNITTGSTVGGGGGGGRLHHTYRKKEVDIETCVNGRRV